MVLYEIQWLVRKPQRECCDEQRVPYRQSPLCAAEDCLYTGRKANNGAFGRGLFEHVTAVRIVRVPQLRCLLAIKGTTAGLVINRQSRQTGVAFSLATFFWRRKRKSPAAGLPPAILKIGFMLPTSNHIEPKTWGMRAAGGKDEVIFLRPETSNAA